MCSNNLEPVQRSEDGCDVRTFRSFNYSTCKTVLHKTVQEKIHTKKANNAKYRKQNYCGSVASYDTRPQWAKWL